MNAVRFSLNDTQAVYDYLLHSFYLLSPSDLIWLNMFIHAVLHKTFADTTEKEITRRTMWAISPKLPYLPQNSINGVEGSDCRRLDRHLSIAGLIASCGSISSPAL